MQNKIMKFGAKVTAAATMLAMFASVSPAMAEYATAMSDTMSSSAASSATAAHEISITLPATGGTWDGTITLSFDNAGGSDFDFSGSTITDNSGTCTAETPSGDAAGVITFDITTCADSETILLSVDASVNSDEVGSHAVYLLGTDAGSAGAGPNDLTGTLAVNITDDDQVTVSAQVSPSITFDLDTGLAAGETPAPYEVDLGSLSTLAVNSSDNTDVNSIFAQLDTNAGSGAVVTVLSFNGADGLASLSVPTDFIPSATDTMAAGTANYGLCVASSTQDSGSFDEVGGYSGATCTPGGSANDVVILDDTVPTPILDSNDLPIVGGEAEIVVNAAIDDTTVSHTDYQDILTFVATGTF